MIIVFSLLMVLGFVQLLLWVRQRKRTQHLELNFAGEKIYTQTMTQRLQMNSAGRKIGQIINDARFHLLGPEGELRIKHGIIIVVAMGCGTYINNEYLQFSLHFVLPALLFFTLYALYLRSKNKMRLEFESGFAEALNIINSSIRSGNSVLQGIEQCGYKLDGLVGKEFREVAKRIEIGEDTENVFMDSYRRQPYREYFFFIITVLINQKGGGQIKEVMSRLGMLISNGRVMQRKKLAMTSEVRMSIKILTVIPVGFLFFLKYQSPDSFNILLYNPVGQYMLFYAIGSILFGLLVIWLMMNKI